MGRTSTRPTKRQFTTETPSFMKRPLHEGREAEEEIADDSREQIGYEEDDQVMSQNEDANSIPTTMGIRASIFENGTFKDSGGTFPSLRFPLNRASSREIKSKEFVIPQTPLALAAAAAQATEDEIREKKQEEFEDDISILTEFSGMEDEEDASSQVTAGAETVVTTTTGSTTIPTRNIGHVAPISASSRVKMNKRRKMNVPPPFDNSQFKRRRML